MRFERLRAPGFQLPDLVAFNRRILDRVGPWFERRWAANIRTESGNSSSVKSSLVLRTSARSIAFSSSRTVPGHG